MIIFGVTWAEQPIKGGTQASYPCPTCGIERSFSEHRMRKVFTLYWMPVFTLEKGEHFWKCPVCKSRYEIPIAHLDL